MRDSKKLLILLSEFKTRSTVMSTAELLIVVAIGWAAGGFIVAMLLGRIFRSADLEPEDSSNHVSAFDR
ncbi:MAG: hypothetical protein A2W18_12145 [Candidatus Muproteobacteria bacterium RBG_16_60_9]|uniref:Uncharacterized protein n=1 Tax=Candidatus Muproteobacteria bacterium RBG_16_60_9 TaxID=1817755 RepID=A0A1F6VKT9_9PROT|nr:MAG: hypothetical protein A2W18_12145 [Candidatus Muproteobacteria bacterium RBG_16_60_9]